MSEMWETNNLDTIISDFIHFIYENFASPIPEKQRITFLKKAIENKDYNFLYNTIKQNEKLFGEILEFLYEWSWIPYFYDLPSYIKEKHVKLWINNHLEDLPEAKLIKELNAYDFLTKSLKILLNNLIIKVKEYESEVY